MFKKLSLLTFSINKFILLPFVLVLSTQIVFSQKSLSVETLDISNNLESSAKIDFGNSGNSIQTVGLHIEGVPLTSSQKGGSYGILANTYSDYSVHNGKSFGRLALSKTFSGDAFFVGAGGHVETTKLGNSNNLFSRVIGGDFSVLPTTIVTPTGNKHWIAGVRTVLDGTINYTRTSSSEGAFAALVAIDDSDGSADTWAGYFQGKSYLSDKTIIGRTEIPTMASTFDVSNFNLFVKGGILTEECLILTEDQWADYVFEPTYKLQPLAEVEQFIEDNGHLPNIPAGETLDKNGIPLAKMTILQQEKIEELFLHSIQMNKENKALKVENEALKNRLEKIEARLLALEK